MFLVSRSMEPTVDIFSGFFFIPCSARYKKSLTESKCPKSPDVLLPLLLPLPLECDAQ